MIVRSTQLETLSRVQHGFLTRAGGGSEGAYESLNCGRANGDDKEHVAENRRRAVMAVDPKASLCTARQVHGINAVTVDTAWPAEHPPHADALITNRPGLALGITTADCAPVLIADRTAGIVAAVHAGWRGALAGVIEATITAMVGVGGTPDHMIAAVGPCIAQRSYEVGPEFSAPFLDQDPANRRFFEKSPKKMHFHFDLAAYVGSRIGQSGVRTAEILRLDTCTDEARFFSYRRACLRGETAFGLGLSVISLR